MRIMLLDCKFGLPNGELHRFESVVSAFDYDVVIWDVEGTANRLRILGDNFSGVPSLDTAASINLLEGIKRRREEFRELVELGRVVAVLASGSEIFSVDSGKRRSTGTGRNEKIVRVHEDIDLLSFVVPAVECEASRGLEIEIADERIRPLWRTTAKGWLYRGILTKWPGDPLLRVANTNKTVGSISEHTSGGVLVVLPEPWVPEEENEDDEPERTNETTAANQVTAGVDGEAHDIEESEDESEDRLFNAKELVRWLEGLVVQDSADVPDWLDSFWFAEEIGLNAEVLAVQRKISDLETDKERLEAALAAGGQWKRLITGDGAALERQVLLAFEALGFEALSVVRGRSDLRIAMGDQRFVIEVKGTRKSAAEKHAAQLEKWVAEEAASGIPAKGVLVVNGWRELPLDQRTEPVFPAQMIDYSTARSHCLISGLQLLSVVRAVQRGEVSADEVAGALASTSGRLRGWDDWRTLFVATEKTTGAAAP